MSDMREGFGEYFSERDLFLMLEAMKAGHHYESLEEWLSEIIADGGYIVAQHLSHDADKKHAARAQGEVEPVGTITSITPITCTFTATYQPGVNGRIPESIDRIGTEIYTRPPSAAAPDSHDIKRRIGNWVKAVVTDCRRNNHYFKSREGSLEQKGFEHALSLVEAKVEYFEYLDTPSDEDIREHKRKAYHQGQTEIIERMCQIINSLLDGDFEPRHGLLEPWLSTHARLVERLSCPPSAGVPNSLDHIADANKMVAISDLIAERQRQNEKWGGPHHDDQHQPGFWTQLIQDYAGWARVMAGMDSPKKYRNRMVQVAALAVAAIETLDRVGGDNE